MRSRGGEQDRQERVLEVATATTLSVGAISSGLRLTSAEGGKPARLGMEGVGGLGTNHLQLLLEMGGVTVDCPDFTRGKWGTRNPHLLPKHGAVSKTQKDKETRGVDHFS
jgi:hypothetical protein